MVDQLFINKWHTLIQINGWKYKNIISNEIKFLFVNLPIKQNEILSFTLEKKNIRIMEKKKHTKEKRSQNYIKDIVKTK